MQIRQATEQDAEAIWAIFSTVVATGDTYVFLPNTPISDFKKIWFGDTVQSFVAIIGDEVVGSYFIKPNQVGLGNHIANAGYMVSPQARGQGIGRAMCEHSLQIAKANGYLGMQYNIVVSTNQSAVRLWEKCGFRIIGTTPNGFRHAAFGLVDTYIMYRAL